MVIYIIEEGCPLCGSDVRGNQKYRYYCKACNLLFEKEHLTRKEMKVAPPAEAKKAEAELKEVQKELEETRMPETIDYTEETEPLEEPEPELPVQKIAEEPEEIRIVASSKSDKMHISTCHFLKKINKENWIYLDSLEEGIKKEYVPCVCIRRKGLMKI